MSKTVLNTKKEKQIYIDKIQNSHITIDDKNFVYIKSSESEMGNGYSAYTADGSFLGFFYSYRYAKDSLSYNGYEVVFLN